MRGIRRHLRAYAMLWLLGQTAQLAALVPVDCCLAHRTPAASSATCHRDAAPPHCPLAARGAQCPMRANHAQPHRSNDAAPAECAMRGACGGPFAALLVLLSNQSILTRPTGTIPTFESRSMSPADQIGVIARLGPPDPPPPRG